MKITQAKVLIIDDNEDVLLAAKMLLKPHVAIIHTEKDPENIPQALKNETYDVIFLDMNFTKDITSGQEGFYWLCEIFNIDPSAVVILITAFGDVEMAVKAVKEGATDFILKPWQNEKFLATLQSALSLRETRIELEKIRSREKVMSEDLDQKFPELIGSSAPMLKVLDTIEKVAKTDANVFILGENGTGKELIARAVHRNSLRKDKTFISVDLGALTPTLFESELFGHVKGAFTDARENRAGRFEIASGGTLFLDEIGNLPVEFQAKLLTILQNRKVARVGSNLFKDLDIRLICATNMPIYQMVAENKFRQDLLYRINTVEIQIPPLREREEDVRLLAEYFLDIYKKKYNKPNLRIGQHTIKKLENYLWPGNVRELQHAIERCVILCEDQTIQPHDFFFSPLEENNNNNKLTFGNLNLDEIEKTIIRKALSKNEGNISNAAKELGLTRASLYRRMEKHGL